MKTTLTLSAFALIFLLASPAANAAEFADSRLAATAATAPDGYWKDVTVKVWNPGHYEQVWVDAVYRRRFCGGRWIRECVRRGYYRKVWHRGYYSYRTDRVWVSDGYGGGVQGGG